MKNNLPASLWGLLSTIIVIVIGLIDWVTGYELNFFVFYFIPVSIAAWYIGLGASLGISVLCALVWFGADVMSGHVHSLYFYAAWNTMIRLASFLAIGWALSKIRQLLDRHYKLSEDLRRSINEMNNIYSMSDSVKQTDIFEELLQNIVNQMPQNWYYPEQACARITFHDQEFKTANFQETAWNLSAEVRSHGEYLGAVDVYYLNEMPDRDEGPFRMEERRLINSVARFVERIIAYRQVAEALRESEAKFREIYETIDDLYFEADPAGNIKVVSPSVKRLTGWNEEELIGRPDTIVYANPEDEKWVRERIIEDGRVNDIEILMKRKNGGIWYASLTARRFLDENGKSTGVRGVLRDMTTRKLMEEEREGLISELREALSEVKQLSGLLPICSSCKKIRDDTGYWNQIETYIKDHSEAEFSHGICPDCMKRLYPDAFEKLQKAGKV